MSGFEPRQLGTNICALTTTSHSKGTRKLGSGKSEGWCFSVCTVVNCLNILHVHITAGFFFFKLGKFQVPRNTRTLTGVGLGEAARTSSQRLRKHSRATRPQRGSLRRPSASLVPMAAAVLGLGRDPLSAQHPSSSFFWHRSHTLSTG